ncbi:MAG: hypothetical protein F4X00_03875 [Gemmatimonadetes bacterium]|nr:hypothetical protein [Gemmatimonadota bacterium]
MKMRGARRRGARDRCEVRTRRSGRTGRAMLTVAALALALLAAFPDVAHACPVCFDRDDEARIAFLATTGLLTLVPLGLVAGTGLWLRRRAREIAEEEERGEG